MVLSLASIPGTTLDFDSYFFYSLVGGYIIYGLSYMYMYFKLEGLVEMIRAKWLKD